MTTTVLALDVGGANLKASDGVAFHASRPFALWKDPAGLQGAIAALLNDAPSCERIAVTMTGELCDCFRTKRDGVAAIVDAVVAAAAENPQVEFYLTDGTIVSADDAKRRYLQTAASNWHATASFVARRFAPQAGILIDVGSTTSDLIRFADGGVNAVGRTDAERLASDELLYTGVVRSPICAVTPTLPWRGKVCGVAQELFATTLDAYLRLGLIDEDEADQNTADGRPATREFARERLARCVCADRETFSDDDADAAAKVVRHAQVRRLAEALGRLLQTAAKPPRLAVVAGQGEFLATLALRHAGWVGPCASLSDAIGAEASRVAPAFALAHLARGDRDLR